MDDATKFIRIFGEHQGRATYSGRLQIRDAAFIADIKARVSGLAALDNRERSSGWLLEISPVRTDDLTERSFFDAVLVSAIRGERRLPFRVGRDWVEMGETEGPVETSARNNSRNIDMALEAAFHRAVVREPAALEVAA